jgi:hypothetical protein
MFRSCDHLQVEIYTLEINSTTDNGSIVFRILVNLVDNGDVVIVAEISYCELLYLAWLIFWAVDVFRSSCITDTVGSRLALHAVLPNVFHSGILFLMCSCWSKVTSLQCYGVISGGSICTLVVSWMLVESGVSGVTVTCVKTKKIGRADGNPSP